MNTLSKIKGSVLTAVCALAVMAFSTLPAQAQATAPPAFSDVTDAIDIMAPLGDFAAFMGVLVAAVIVVGLAFTAIFLGYKAIRRYVTG